MLTGLPTRSVVSTTTRRGPRGDTVTQGGELEAVPPRSRRAPLGGPMSVAVGRPPTLVVGEEHIRQPGALVRRMPLGISREPLVLAAALFGVTWVVFGVLAALDTTA